MLSLDRSWHASLLPNDWGEGICAERTKEWVSCSDVDLEARLRSDYRLRTIRALVNKASVYLERDFAAL